jgi:dipeptidyl aminopeptidase/acylaminoacyl peptidase
LHASSFSREIIIMKSSAVCAMILTVIFARAAVSAEPRLMTAEDLWKVKRVGPPSVSPDGQSCVVDVTTWNLDNDESSSNLWLLSTDGKRQTQLTNTTGKNGGPKWSPDGNLIAFTSQRAGDEVAQIYVIAPAGGEARRVSIMAMASSGLKWSADSRTIYSIGWTWPDAPDDVAHKAKEKSLKDARSKAVVIDDTEYRVWDKWIADGKRPMIFATDLQTGRHRNLLAKSKRFLPPTEPPPSANDYDVSPVGTELCFVADSSANYGLDFNSDLYTLDLAGDSEPKNITADNQANDTGPVYSPDGKHMAFLRQTIKFFSADRQRLMVLDRDSGTKTELAAAFNRSCQNLKWADAKRLTFEAENGGAVGIYFINLDGKMPSTSAPPVSERSIDFARGRRLAVYLQSSFDRPPTVVAHGPGMKDPIPLEHFNDTLERDWKLGKVEYMTFNGAGDKEVPQWIVYPPNFNPNKKWPFVQVVHGGPHAGIMNDWSARWNLQLWAAQGFVVGCVNFHGSSGYGQEFTDAITGALGDKPLIDVMRSTDWFEKQPWIDKDRMVAAGASYGGYMMAWLNGHTDRFKAMVCHAGVYDWHAMLASDMIRGRFRALGAPPWGDLSIVDNQSPQRFAANFKTPTLILHGEKDFRVPITQGLAYFNTLRQKGVPTRLVYFPDENHWVLKPNNSLLWHREVFGWLKKYAGTGPT